MKVSLTLFLFMVFFTSINAQENTRESDNTRLIEMFPPDIIEESVQEPTLSREATHEEIKRIFTQHRGITFWTNSQQDAWWDSIRQCSEWNGKCLLNYEVLQLASDLSHPRRFGEKGMDLDPLLLSIFALHMEKHSQRNRENSISDIKEKAQFFIQRAKEAKHISQTQWENYARFLIESLLRDTYAKIIQYEEKKEGEWEKKQEGVAKEEVQNRLWVPYPMAEYRDMFRWSKWDLAPIGVGLSLCVIGPLAYLGCFKEVCPDGYRMFQERESYWGSCCTGSEEDEECHPCEKWRTVSKCENLITGAITGTDRVLRSQSCQTGTVIALPARGGCLIVIGLIRPTISYLLKKAANVVAMGGSFWCVSAASIVNCCRSKKFKALQETSQKNQEQIKWILEHQLTIARGVHGEEKKVKEKYSNLIQLIEGV